MHPKLPSAPLSPTVRRHYKSCALERGEYDATRGHHYLHYYFFFTLSPHQSYSESFSVVLNLPPALFPNSALTRVRVFEVFKTL